MNFSKGEEDLMEAQVKAIKDAGANVVVTGGKVADMALHYANKYKLMVVRWVSLSLLPSPPSLAGMTWIQSSQSREEARLDDIVSY